MNAVEMREIDGGFFITIGMISTASIMTCVIIERLRNR